MTDKNDLEINGNISNNQENIQMQFFPHSMAPELQHIDPAYQPKVEIEENLCRFCQQTYENGVMINDDNISSLLPYLPVYISPSDPAILSPLICITCVQKMNIVKDFFSLIYHSYKNVLQDVDIFFKFDMMTITREIEASDVEVKLKEDHDNFGNAAEYVKVEQVEHSDNNIDDNFAAKEITPLSNELKPKIIKKSTKGRKDDGPQKQFRNGKIVILRKRSKRKYVRIESLATLCTCTECGRQFSSQEENIHHWDEEHTGQTLLYKCCEEEVGCNFSSSNSVETKAHLKQHMLDLGFMKECEICKKLIKKLYFSRHYEMHLTEGVTYQCDLCEAVLKNKSSLESHRKAHVEKKEKNHQCNMCEKRFHTKGQLKAHINSFHLNIREHKCPSCDKEFTNFSTLTAHINATHNDFKEKFVCETCGASYATKETLRHHVDGVHRNVFKFNCTLCPAKFNRRDQYNQHLKIHTGEKPFTCLTCGKGFRRKDTLRDHEKKHLPEEQRSKLYCCKFCGKSLSSSGSLWNHIKLSHKEKDI